MITELGRTLSDLSLCAQECILLEGLDGEVFGKAMNWKHFKKYYPSISINS